MEIGDWRKRIESERTPSPFCREGGASLLRREGKVEVDGDAETAPKQTSHLTSNLKKRPTNEASTFWLIDAIIYFSLGVAEIN